MMGIISKTAYTAILGGALYVAVFPPPKYVKSVVLEDPVKYKGTIVEISSYGITNYSAEVIDNLKGIKKSNLEKQSMLTTALKKTRRALEDITKR